MQMEVVSWWSTAHRELGVPEILLWHTPNGSVYGGSKENRERIGAMMKRMGCREGVPDLFLAVTRRGPMASMITGLFVEMKTLSGVVSPTQYVMLATLEVQGFKTAVCRTVEDAKRVITDYLK